MSSKTYAVTLRARAEMVVWVDAETATAAKRAALDGDYEQMTGWELTSISVVKANVSKASEETP